MFPKSHRLVKKREIDKVFRQGGYASAGFLYLNVLPNRCDNYRAVVIVGKKSGLKAVGRNLLKRRAREVLKMAIDQDKLSKCDIVLGFKGKFDKVPKYNQIQELIAQCVKKLRLPQSGAIKSHYRRTTGR